MLSNDDWIMMNGDRDKRAVLWDLDGTLIDTVEYHWQAWRDTMAREGSTLTRARFLEAFGHRNDTALRVYFRPDLSDSEIVRIGEAKEACYRKLVRRGGVEVLPGVRNWLERLKRDGWRQALATSAPALNVEAILSVVDFARCFDAIVSADDVQFGKPDPQIFLTAAKKLGIAPARCIVVEDSPAGVEAARRAGMRSIGVPSSHQQLDASLVVTSLANLPLDAFDRLLEYR